MLCSYEFPAYFSSSIARSVELYDHRNDTSTSFGKHENVNLAHLPEYKDTVAQLHTLLKESWPKPDQ